MRSQDPTRPRPAPADLAARYITHLNGIRLGFIMSLIVVVLYMPWSALLATQ